MVDPTPKSMRAAHTGIRGLTEKKRTGSWEGVGLEVGVDLGGVGGGYERNTTHCVFV